MIPYTAMEMPLSLNDTAIRARVTHALHCLCVYLFLHTYYNPLHSDLVAHTHFFPSCSSFWPETGSNSISLGDSQFA